MTCDKCDKVVIEKEKGEAKICQSCKDRPKEKNRKYCDLFDVIEDEENKGEEDFEMDF